MPQSQAMTGVRYWLQKNRANLLWTCAIAAVCALLSYFVPLAWMMLFHRELTLYYGPRGGSGERLARTIDEYSKQQVWNGNNFGRRFDMHLEHTDGGEDNRQVVELDTQGNTLGFAADGIKPPNEKIRTLLPLYSMELHVMIRKDAYERIRREAAIANGLQRTLITDLFTGGAKDPRTFNALLLDMAKAQQPLRLFLGNSGSDTRFVAEAVLDNFGVDPSDVDCFHQLDWSEVGKILATDRLAGPSELQIDGALYLGPIGAKWVEEAAGSKQCLLLGIDSVPGLIATHPQFRPATIFKHSYHAGNAFCDRDLNTVKVRQVVICPSRMKESDAYLLAKMFSTAFREKLPDVAWDEEILGAGKALDLRYPLHPGAAAFRSGQAPSWFGVVVWFWTALLLPWHRVILSYLGSIVAWFQGSTPNAQLDAARTERGRALKRELQAMQLDWESLPGAQLEETAYAQWLARIQAFRATLLQEINGQGIREAAADELLVGIRSLRVELASRRPASLPDEISVKLDEELRDVLVEVQTFDKDIFDSEAYDAYLAKSKGLKDRILTAIRARQLSRDRGDDLVTGLKELREELRQRRPRRPRNKPSANGTGKTT